MWCDLNAACSYIVACGILDDDGEGFYQIKDRNDPVQSALQVMAFAKDMLRVSNEVRRGTAAYLSITIGCR